MIEIHGRSIPGRAESFCREVECENGHAWLQDFRHETDTNATYPVGNDRCSECNEIFSSEVV